MIKVCGAKYVVFGVSDPGKTKQFMTDFGLAPVAWHGETAYLRGALASPYVYVAEKSDAPSLKAFGMEVGSAESCAGDRDRRGVSVRDLDRPGGGGVSRSSSRRNQAGNRPWHRRCCTLAGSGAVSS